MNPTNEFIEVELPSRKLYRYTLEELKFATHLAESRKASFRRKVMQALISVFVAFTVCSPNLRAASQVSSDEALKAVVDGAKASDSDAMIVVRDGKVLADYRKPGSHGDGIEMMSATKSLVALGVGRLLTQGKIKSIDQPVSDFYPEWKQGRKAKITLRMLLNHTSGLQNEPNTTLEIYPAPDCLKLALAAELTDPPGEVFSYNNKAMNLLGGVIELVSGKRMDAYIEKELLAPMEITDASWNKDGFDRSGHPYAMAGWNSTAQAAIKIGRFVLDEGRWNGKQLVSADYMRQMVGQGQPLNPSYGLLWWRRPARMTVFVDEAGIRKFEQAGIANAPLQKLRTLLGRHFASGTELREALRATLGADFQALGKEAFEHKLSPEALIGQEPGPIVAYEANGYHGQYIVVIPAARLVAVRQIGDRPEGNGGKPWPFSYDDFTQRVIALAETFVPVLDIKAK